MNYDPPFCIWCRKGDELLETAYVYLQNEIIGSAQIERCGLYVRFRCTCDLPAGSMYRIWIMGLKSPIELGVLIPKDGKFSVDKKIAAKRFGAGEVRLVALPLNQRGNNKFVPIQSDAQFLHLECLCSAKFGWEDGCCGVYWDGDPG